MSEVKNENLEFETRDDSKGGPKKVLKNKKSTGARPRKVGSKKKNPLFVVTNNGKDVEEAVSLLDAFVKRFGLEPVREILNMLMAFIAENVKSYAMFMVVKEYFDQLVAMLTMLEQSIADKLAPYTEKANEQIEKLMGRISAFL